MFVGRGETHELRYGRFRPAVEQLEKDITLLGERIREMVGRQFDLFCSYLQGPDLESRIVAAGAIGFSRSRVAVPLLLPLLNDTERSVRHTAAIVIRESQEARYKADASPEERTQAIERIRLLLAKPSPNTSEKQK